MFEFPVEELEALSGFGSFGATVPGKVSDFRKSFVFLYFPLPSPLRVQNPFFLVSSRCVCGPLLSFPTFGANCQKTDPPPKIINQPEP